MIARSITLDTSRAGSQLSMTVRKGETSIYSLAVSFCEKGTPIYVPDTYTAILRGYKADGTAVSRNATITGGRVTTGFPEQSFTAVGVAQFEIDCYGPGGEVLFSPEFDVLVEDTVSEGAVQSSNDFTALQQALMLANRGFVIQGVPYASIGALKAAITEPNMGDLYEVVDGFAYDIYRWTGDTSVGDDGWLNHGHISGKSAYEVAVDGGYAGTQAEWLASLVGASGTPGEPGGTGEPGAAGTSAYLHIRWGTSATPSTLLEIPDEYIGVASTSNAIAPATYDGYVWYKYKGEDGSPGAPGEPGAPGDPGTPGASAYVHIRWGTSETPATLLTSPNDYIGIASTSSATAPDDYTGYNWYQYKGADGDPGSPGAGLPTGGAVNQIPVKSSTTDYATAWGNAILQYSTMPTAAAGLAGQIAQFTGATGTYTNGYTYICQSDGGAGYEWAEHTTGDYATSAQGIPTGGTAGQALVKSSATDYATEWGNTQLQYSTMPTAAIGNLGWIVTFTGATDASYTHGHVYECVSSGGGSPTYSWAKLSTTPTTDLLNMVYPVGSIYMSVVNTSPASFLGGTWAAWGTGRVLVGVDTSQTEFNTVEQTGGEKTHALTSSENGPHDHTIRMSDDGEKTSLNLDFLGGRSTTMRFQKNGSYGGGGSWSGTGLSGESGSGSAHNNLQPYITCYMWKRTA